MLSRRFRLRTADFEVTYNKGRRLRHPLLLCRYRLRPPIAGINNPRVAFVVPRRLAKAVHRNRWKRRMRHAFREISLKSVSDGCAQSKWNRCDLIFILTQQGMKAPPQEMSEAMNRLCQKVFR